MASTTQSSFHDNTSLWSEYSVSDKSTRCDYNTETQQLYLNCPSSSEFNHLSIIRESSFCSTDPEETTEPQPQVQDVITSAVSAFLFPRRSGRTTPTQQSEVLGLRLVPVGCDDIDNRAMCQPPRELLGPRPQPVGREGSANQHFELRSKSKALSRKMKKFKKLFARGSLQVLAVL